MQEVSLFENTIANYYGSQYAIATDCCTHAIELCLRYKTIKKTTVPKHTYLSVPMTCVKLGIEYEFVDNKWENYYVLGNTNIIDAAVYFKANSYISNTFMCLSFQYKKHLNLGRGGMILTDDIIAATALKKMSYDGRTTDKPWMEQNIDTIGYHYYMTPETALQGIERFETVKNIVPRQWSYIDYSDISLMNVFNS